LEAAGLVSKYEDSGNFRDFFRGRLIFPIRDTQGRPIGFGGRILPQFANDKTGKYVNPRETRLYTKSETLYALDIARNHVAKTRQLTIVEGYTDVILCHQHGVNDVIACCGTAVTDRHIRLLKRFADTVYLVLDGDAAGQSRTNDILELFVAAQMDLRILTLPDEYDPAEFMEEKGGDAFRALLGGAIDALEHKIRTETAGIDLARDTHRANLALENILKTIAGGLSGGVDAASLRAAQLIARLARQFGLDEADVRTRFQQLRKGTKASDESTERTPGPPRSHKLAALSPFETELLEILCLHPELAPTALADVADGDLASPTARELLATYRRLEESGDSLEFNTVLGEIEAPELKHVLVELDDLAHEKSPKAILSGPDRLRSVIRQIHQQHELRELRQRQAMLEERALSPEEEIEELNRQKNAKLRQQGIIVPMDG
jgi:DNA primase